MSDLCPLINTMTNSLTPNQWCLNALNDQLSASSCVKRHAVLQNEQRPLSREWKACKNSAWGSSPGAADMFLLPLQNPVPYLSITQRSIMRRDWHLDRVTLPSLEHPVCFSSTSVLIKGISASCWCSLKRASICPSGLCIVLTTRALLFHFTEPGSGYLVSKKIYSVSHKWFENLPAFLISF